MMGEESNNPLLPSDVEETADGLEGEDSQPSLIFDKEENFPPLPYFCCVGPCFHIDIKQDIPIESQPMCRMLFLLWKFNVFCLFFNCIGCLTALCVGLRYAGIAFGLALLYLVIFTPLSFIMWYRRIYKTLKDSSSFSYWPLFYYSFKVVFVVLHVIGIPFTYHLSVLFYCGWINAASVMKSNWKWKTGVSVIYVINASLFTILAIFKILALRKLVAAHRKSGRGFQMLDEEDVGDNVEQDQDEVPPPVGLEGFA